MSLASNRETSSADSRQSPQPFSVNEVKACDETKRCDKLYVDDKALLVNVLIGVSRRITISPYYALTICAFRVHN